MEWYKDLSLNNITATINGSFFIEEWRIIDEFPDYQISSFGRVKSNPRLVNNGKWSYITNEKIKSQRLDYNGYLMTDLYSTEFKNKKVKTAKVHRLVAIAFVTNTENKPTVNHVSPIKTNNFFNNLEWATRLEQSQHAFKEKLMNNIIGEKCNKAILKEDQVLKIRNEFTGKRGEYAKIARDYNISPEGVMLIIKRKTWKHI